MTGIWTRRIAACLTLAALAACGGGGGGGGGDAAATAAQPAASAALPAAGGTATPTSHDLGLIVNGQGAVGAPGVTATCSSNCRVPVPAGTSVSLIATPAAGQVFAGWSGACTGTGACAFAMAANAEVTASFVPQSVVLSVVASGSGTVQGQGISCGGDCSETYPQGTSVSLSASAADGHRFSGWSGACSGTGDCVVSLQAASSVTASFVPLQHVLTVQRSGNGSVQGQGISCGSDCSEALAQGSLVALTATPDAGHSFAGWGGGACSGSGACVVTLAGATTVSASFNPVPVNNHALNVQLLGATGGGSVAGSGIACGTDCAEVLAQGSVVTLTATPTANHVFSGWSGGGCSGTAACAVTLNSTTTVAATFTALTHTLSVAASGNGTVSGAGISCGSDCSETLAQGSTLTLTAAAAANHSFSGWSGGGCSGTGSCTVTLNAATSVTANFAPITHVVSVLRSGSGSVSASGINCGSDCSEAVAQGASLVLSATPAAGQQFAGWAGGGCTGTGSCTLTVSAAATVTASFTPILHVLTATVAGGGSVVSAPAGISCPGDCSESLAQGSGVTLTASPAAGQRFVSWTGACSGSGSCVLSLASAATVGASFEPITHGLTVAVTGNGTVTGAGINCGTDCSEPVAQGTVVLLTATPAANQRFVGWSGGCTGTGTCNVTVAAATAVAAAFAPITHVLTVSLSGSGTVTGTGINCGSDCTETLNQGTALTLTAAPAANQRFTGWSGGGCSGTATCTVNLSAVATVVASFAPITHVLTVSVSGSGTVTGTGINCGSDCTETLNQGTALTLTAAPAANQRFTGWSGGGCSGTATCTVNLSAAATVVASFAPITHVLTVSVSGSGTVTGTGINCGSDCTETLNQGTALTLTAAPAANQRFAGWSGGGCSGTATCTVNLSAAATVVASFAPITHALTVTVTGQGGVGSAPAGITCPSDCSETLAQGTQVTLAATAVAGHSFTGWGGACAGTGTCVVTLNAATAVTASFTPILHALTVSKVGSGTVTATGINCGTDCNESYAQGTVVSLAVSPAAGYTFSGWSGACTGTSPCSVTMAAARTVTATFSVATAQGCTLPRSTATTATIGTGHPRILLNHAATLACLQQLLANGTPSATRFKTMVDNQLANGNVYDFQPWYAALMYHVTGELRYANYAVAQTEAFVASEEALINANQRATVAGDSYLEVGPRIGSVMLVYDWCYPLLSEAQRARWVTYANQAVWNVWNHTQARWGNTVYAWSGWSVDNPANNYYYSFLRATMMLGLASHGENTQAQAWIDKFRTEKLQNQLFVTFDRDLTGGGSREGTGYGTAMKGLWALYDWWERSTGERIATKTPHTLASMAHMLHSIVPTLDRLAPTGDHARDETAALFDYHREFLLELITLFPQERLSAAAKAALDASSVPRMANSFEFWVDFMYEAPQLAAGSLSDLSTTYWGSGTGQLMMRSDWTTSAAFANFICGPYTESHAHRDQGSFVLYRGAWLADDANMRSASGIEQAEELHNLVRIEQAGATVTQVGYRQPCNMAALEDNADYTYALADVTPVYNGKAAVAKVEREFLFIRPSTFVVFDRVDTAAGARRVWTLNMAAAPTIAGDTFTATSGSNSLTVRRLAPTGLSTQWVSNRVEVADSTGTQSLFLNVLGTNGSVTAATRSDATGQTGASITLADGRQATVRFSNNGRGGTLELRSAGGAVLRSGAFGSTVTTPPLFRN